MDLRLGVILDYCRINIWLIPKWNLWYGLMAIIISLSLDVIVSYVIAISIIVTKVSGLLVVSRVCPLEWLINFFMGIVVIVIIWFLCDHFIVSFMSFVYFLSNLSYLLLAHKFMIFLIIGVRPIISISIAFVFVVISWVRLIVSFVYVAIMVSISWRISLSVLWLRVESCLQIFVPIMIAIVITASTSISVS